MFISSSVTLVDLARFGYQELLVAGWGFADRLWAVTAESASARHIADRLVHDGESVLDAPT